MRSTQYSWPRVRPCAPLDATPQRSATRVRLVGYEVRRLVPVVVGLAEFGRLLYFRAVRRPGCVASAKHERHRARRAAGRPTDPEIHSQSAPRSPARWRRGDLLATFSRRISPSTSSPPVHSPPHAGSMSRGSDGVPRRTLVSGLILLTASMNLVACGGSDEYRFATPSGVLSPEVAPTEDGRVYFLRSAYGGTESPAELWRTEPDQGTDSRVAVDTSNLSCRSPFLFSLRTMPDGRLGAAASCPEDREHAGYVAFAVTAGGVVATPLAPLTVDDDVVWSADGRSGWIIRSSRGCAGIAAMGLAGAEPFGEYTPSNLLPWKIDGDFFGAVRDREDCTSRGRAAFPALTADGEALLFLASPASAGVSPNPMGTGRDQLTWNLYRLALKSRSLEMLATGFSRPTGLVAGDGGSVLVTGARGGRQGVWRIDAGSRKVESVKAGNFGPPSLSPDHRSVIIVRYSYSEPEEGDTTLVRFPIGES